jgi:hypothetical protein
MTLSPDLQSLQEAAEKKPELESEIQQKNVDSEQEPRIELSLKPPTNN